MALGLAIGYNIDKIRKKEGAAVQNGVFDAKLRELDGEYQSLRDGLDCCREEDVERAVDIYRERYARAGMHECTLYPGVQQMLARLKEAGLFLATATSKPRDVVLPILKEQNILPYFDLVGGASMDKSVDTKTAVIRQDLADSRLAGRRILMVGDRQDDMKGAADCGLPAAAVLYGYGSRAELEPWHPVLWAENTTALGDAILQAE